MFLWEQKGTVMALPQLYCWKQKALELIWRAALVFCRVWGDHLCADIDSAQLQPEATSGFCAKPGEAHELATPLPQSSSTSDLLAMKEVGRGCTSCCYLLMFPTHLHWYLQPTKHQGNLCVVGPGLTAANCKILHCKTSIELGGNTSESRVWWM